MSFLHSEDFRETYLDASDLTDYPTGRLEVDQNIFTVLSGDGDAKMAQVPFVALIATDTTYPGLVNAEHVLAWKQDETNPDKFHVVRDWNYYTVFETEVTGAIDNAPDGYDEGDDTITTSGLAGVEEWNYIRIGTDPQMYRVTAVAGNDLTLEPALLRDVANSEIIRVVADHFRAGTGDVVSRKRVHSDHERVILLQVKIHLEEIQDAIDQLQHLAYPVDLVADTLTLANHLRLGGVKSGYPDAAGMVKFAGGRFQGYDGADWKFLDETGGGGGDTLPGGSDGDTLRYDSGWVSTDLFQVHDDHAIFDFGTRVRIDEYGMSLDGALDAQEVSGHYIKGSLGLFNNTDLFNLPSAEGFFVGHSAYAPGQPKMSFLVSAHNFSLEAETSKYAGLSIITGSGIPTNPAHLYSAQWSHTGYVKLEGVADEAYPGEGGLIFYGEKNIRFFAGGGENPFITIDGEANKTLLHRDLSFSNESRIHFDNDAYIEFVGRTSYPSSPANGTMIYHGTDGFRVYQGGGWHPIVGDDLEFTAPGQPWSALVWDPTADSGAGDWVYTNELTIEPIGVRIQKALIVGARNPEMSEEVGLIEYVNGDFQGIVAGPDGQGTLRVSLTNISPEQRLPAADLALGAFMYAAQDGEGRWVWKSTGSLNWDTERIVTPEIRIGAGAGTEGVIRWNSGQNKLEWSDGVTWYSWEQDAVIPDPTTLGAFMFVGGTEESKNWEETTAIAIIDNKLVTATLEVQTIRLGPDGGGDYHEFNADALSFDTMSIHQMTGFIKDSVEPSLDFSEGWGVFKTLSADVLNVNTLNLVADEENPLSFEMERLVIVDSEPNSVRYVWDSAEFVLGQEELRLIHDDLDPYIGFYQEVTSTYTGETVGEHSIGETEISVMGMGTVIEAGTRVTIGNYTYRVNSASGIPTATIIIPAPGLKELIATGSEVVVKYGGLVTHAYGGMIVDYNFRVKGVANFDYSIRLNNINDLDGELDGVPDTPGMIRYNGDFQGRLANGQWASFTRTIMDGDSDGIWGSMLYWRGDQWAKNLNLDANADGALRFQPNTFTSAVPGAIRFTGTDFQGCINVGVWQTLTALEELPVLPSGAGYENATLRWANDNWVVNPNLWSDGIKSGVTLLEIGAYENFYDAGYVVSAGGLGIGVTIIYHEGFSGPLTVGTEIKFDGHAEVYEVTEIISSNRLRIDHGLVDDVEDREWFRVQGVLPRPEAKGGQVRYNQNDFEGFIEGIGWASFTGHRSWLPNRIGDTQLDRGHLLFFSGQEWIADHHSYMGQHVFTLDKDLDVMQDLAVAGSASFNGIHVGSPLTYSNAKVNGVGYLAGATSVGVTHASRALKTGDQFYFSNDQTQLYTITGLDKISGVPVTIYFTPALSVELEGAETLTTFLPQETWIGGEEIINDPTPYPGFIYFNHGRARFRGCLSETDSPESPAWVDLVSPIQMVEPPVMGQTLFYNKEADYWHNNNFLIINGGIIGDDTYYAGWIRSELPLHVMDWQLRTELIPYQGDEADEYNQFTLGFEPDPGASPTNAPLVIHTASELGAVASAFFVNNDNFLAPKIILGSGKSAPLLASDVLEFPAGYELTVFGQSYLDGGVRINSGNLVLATGRLNVQEGNVFIDKGDLVLGVGSLETQNVYAGGVGYFGEYIRVGYTETSGYLPVGAIRYSHPNKAYRGDWEGWDGLQWVSFTAGFHGQAIWIPEGVDLNHTVPFYDENYEGGKFRVDEDFTFNASTGTLTSPKVETDNLDLTTPGGAILKEGRMVWDTVNDQLKFSPDGLAWVDLLRPGNSGLVSGTLDGQTLRWDDTAGQYAVTDNLRILSNRIHTDAVLVLGDYDTFTPPAAAGGQIRYNQNDFEGYVANIGWVSFTGDRPMQDPSDHEGAILFSNGHHWVANDLFKFGETAEDNDDWNIFYFGNVESILSVNGYASINAMQVPNGLQISGSIHWPFHPGGKAVGALHYNDDQDLQYYGPYEGATEEEPGQWRTVTMGKNVSEDDKAIVFWDNENDQFVSTDLMGYDLAIEGAAVPHVIWATNLDIRNGFLNFGDSQNDDGYWEMSSTYSAEQFDLRLIGEEDQMATHINYDHLTAAEDLPDLYEDNALVYYKGTIFMFQATTGDVWKSTDDGDSWSFVGVRNNYATVRSALTIIVYDKTSSPNPRGGVNAKMYMLGGYNRGIHTNKVYESTDGITWAEVGTLPTTCSNVMAIVKHTGLGVTVVGRTDSGGYAPVTWRSNDMISWTTHSTNLNSISLNWCDEWNGVLYVHQGWGGSPYQPTLKLLYSIDHGLSWYPVVVSNHPTVDGLFVANYLLALVGNRLYMILGTKWTTGAIHNRTWYTELPESGTLDEITWTRGFDLNMIGYNQDGVDNTFSDDPMKYPFGSYQPYENNSLRWIVAEEIEYTVSTGQVFMANKFLNKIVLYRPGGTIDLYGDLTLYDHDAVFKQDVTIENALVVEQGLSIGDPDDAAITLTSTLALFKTPVTVGASGDNKDLLVYGKITANEIDTSLTEFYADNFIPRSFISVGQGDPTDAWFGSIRYTGSIRVAMKLNASAGATTITVKGVPGTVPLTVSDEARLILAKNATRFEVTGATDLGGGDWEIDITPALSVGVDVDDVVNLLQPGDWEGWDGSRWISFTRDIGGGGGGTLPDGVNTYDSLYWDAGTATWKVSEGFKINTDSWKVIGGNCQINVDNSVAGHGHGLEIIGPDPGTGGYFDFIELQGADGGWGSDGLRGIRIHDLNNTTSIGFIRAIDIYNLTADNNPDEVYALHIQDGRIYHSIAAGQIDFFGGASMGGLTLDNDVFDCHFDAVDIEADTRVEIGGGGYFQVSVPTYFSDDIQQSAGTNKLWSVNLDPVSDGFVTADGPSTTPVVVGTGKFNGAVRGLAFPHTDRKFLNFQTRLPSDYAGQALKVRATIVCPSTGAATGMSYWRCRIGTFDYNDDVDVATADMGAELAAGDLGDGVLSTIEFGPTTPANATAGATLCLCIDRQSDSVSDVFDASLVLVNVQVCY